MKQQREFDATFPLPGFLPDVPQARMVQEPARSTPVIAECDVAVFGAGPAGICAAAAAARAGRRVVLVKRHGCLGGMATSAGVNLWHSLYCTDGRTPMIAALPLEIIQRLIERDAARNDNAGGTGNWIFDSEQLKFVLDDIAVGSGVRLLLHCLLVDVHRDGRRVTAAFVEGKSGRGAILAESFIDCTGDADLVRQAGLDTQLGDGKGGCQSPSLTFRMAGADADSIGGDALQRELFREPMDYNGEPFPAFVWGTTDLHDPTWRMFAGTRVPNINVADTRDLTRGEVEARYQLRWVLKRLRDVPGWTDARLLDIAAVLGSRESHRILADYQLTRDDVLNGRAFDDTVAQGKYPIDIHSPSGPGLTFFDLDGMTRTFDGERGVSRGRWDGQPIDAPPRRTLCYQVPYRSLIPRGLDNVLVAGRCAGADHHSAGAIRVMVNCMQLGQAAGLAAAVSTGGLARAIDRADLRRKLLAAGAPLLDRTQP